MLSYCFIAAGPIEFASSRLRAYWIAEQMGANVILFSDLTPGWLPSADVIIWQKRADLEAIKATQHAIHIVDFCDPSWWWQPKGCAELCEWITGATFSNEALRQDFNNWCDPGIPTATIPDRMKLEHYPIRRKHSSVTPTRIIWFGLALNRWALNGALANLERLAANGHSIELTIFDDRPDVPFRGTDSFPVYHVRWSLDKENEVISAHDIAILPQYPGAWGWVKSNNRHITAGACGLSVSDGESYSELEFLVTNWAKRGHPVEIYKFLGLDKSVKELVEFAEHLHVPRLKAA